MAESVQFLKWRQQFEGSVAGRNALRQLSEEFDREDPLFASRPLLPDVFASCYGAAVFKAKEDPARVKRLESAKGLSKKKVNQQRTAIRVVRTYLNQFPTVASAALAQAVPELRKRGFDTGSTQDAVRELPELLDDMLKAYAIGLGHPMPLLRHHVEERCAFGCLLYLIPRDMPKRSNFPTARTMLLFDLVHRFRWRSQGVTWRWLGQPMPDNHGGEPHYSLAAALRNATFPSRMEEKIDAEDARNLLKGLLKENPGIGIHPWPNQPAGG